MNEGMVEFFNQIDKEKGFVGKYDTVKTRRALI